MHGLAESSCLGGRPGDIEQNEHREITPTPQAVQVDGFVGRRPGQHLHPRLDRGVDVDVVALCLAVAAVQPDAEARQRPPQRMHIGTRRTGVHAVEADRSRARCTSRAGSACGGRPTRDTSCLRPRCRRASSISDGGAEVDVTMPAPRIPLCDRCVGVSAPGGPPPLSWRTLLISRCSSLPAAPPPPTGLENGSMTSDSAPIVAHPRVLAAPSPIYGVGRGCHAMSDCWALGVHRQQVAGLDHAEARRRIGDLLPDRPRPATRRENRHGWRGRDRSATERDTAAVPRSPPARGGLRRPDTSWPAPGAEPACARRRARGRRLRAATPAPSPIRAAAAGSRRRRRRR